MRKVAVVFSGQGSQYVGMGKELYEKFPEAREVFEEAKEVLGTDILELMFHGDKEELKKTENAQVAVFITSMAAYRVFASRCKVKPVIGAGHSLGEISALTAAGAFSFQEALKLVKDRASYMQKACEERPGTMYAVRNLRKELVKEACDKAENVWVSNYNTKIQTVISGGKEDVKAVAESWKSEDAIVQELSVSGAFHSGLMESAYESMKERVKELAIGELQFPVVSNTTAAIEEMEEIRINLPRQIIMPVRWSETMDLFASIGVHAVIEFGAGHGLSNMFRVQQGSIRTYLFEKETDILSTIQEIKEQYEMEDVTYFEKCLSIAISTKNRNENQDGYEDNVLKNIHFLQSLIKKNELDSIQEDKKNALMALKSILSFKQATREETENRLKELEAY